MAMFLAFLSAFSLLAFLASLIFIFPRRFRKRAKKSAVVWFVTLLLGVFFFVKEEDQQAKIAGFENNFDRMQARKAGFSTSEEWKTKQAELDAAQRAAYEAEQRRLAEERARADAEATVIRAAEDKRLAEEQSRREAERQAKAAAEAREKAVAEAQCRADLRCIGERLSIEAGIACRRWVERLAKNDFQWTDGWLETKFSHYRWKIKTKGIVTYIGDKIKYQNGFGAWIRHTYECDFDTESKRIVDVRAKPGQLPPS